MGHQLAQDQLQAKVQLLLLALQQVRPQQLVPAQLQQRVPALGLSFQEVVPHL